MMTVKHETHKELTEISPASFQRFYVIPENLLPVTSLLRVRERRGIKSVQMCVVPPSVEQVQLHMGQCVVVVPKRRKGVREKVKQRAVRRRAVKREEEGWRAAEGRGKRRGRKASGTHTLGKAIHNDAPGFQYSLPCFHDAMLPYQYCNTPNPVHPLRSPHRLPRATPPNTTPTYGPSYSPPYGPSYSPPYDTTSAQTYDTTSAQTYDTTSAQHKRYDLRTTQTYWSFKCTDAPLDSSARTAATSPLRAAAMSPDTPTPPAAAKTVSTSGVSPSLPPSLCPPVKKRASVKVVGW